MARINHECALDVLREKVEQLKKERAKCFGMKYIPFENEIKSLENTIFTLELDQEPVIFRNPQRNDTPNGAETPL